MHVVELEKEIQQKHFRSEYHKLVINILFTNSWLVTAQSQVFKQVGLTGPQFNVLRILRGQHPKPATVNLIIERMIDKSSNASRIVDKLVTKKLVERHACPHDRRAVDVRITQAGLDLLSQMDEQAADWEEKLFNLTPEEARQANQLLDKLRG